MREGARRSVVRERRHAVLEQKRKRYALGRRGGRMGQRQELLPEPLLALESPDNLLDVLPAPIARFQVFLEELDQSPDRRQRRAHLVRDLCGQRAEDRELIRTLDLIADAPLLGRVAEEEHE